MDTEDGWHAGPLTGLTAFQRDLLLVVADLGGPHGLLAAEELGADYGEEINHGRLYPNLEELIDAGLVEKGKLDDRANQYTLTEEGERRVRAHLDWVVSRAG